MNHDKAREIAIRFLSVLNSNGIDVPDRIRMILTDYLIGFSERESDEAILNLVYGSVSRSTYDAIHYLIYNHAFC